MNSVVLFDVEQLLLLMDDLVFLIDEYLQVDIYTGHVLFRGMSFYYSSFSSICLENMLHLLVVKFT